jgi:hypothetical protein
VEVRRLAGDREVGVVTQLDEEIGRAVRLLLGFLVRNHHEDDAHVGLVPELLDRAHHRRQPALHVVGAAPVEAVALDPRSELLCVRRHHVDVTMEGDGRAVLRTDDRCQHRKALVLELVDLDVARLEPAPHELRRALDPRRARRVIGDQLLGQRLLVQRHGPDRSGLAGHRIRASLNNPLASLAPLKHHTPTTHIL